MTLTACLVQLLGSTWMSGCLPQNTDQEKKTQILDISGGSGNPVTIIMGFPLEAVKAGRINMVGPKTVNDVRAAKGDKKAQNDNLGLRQVHELILPPFKITSDWVNQAEDAARIKLEQEYPMESGHRVFEVRVVVPFLQREGTDRHKPFAIICDGFRGRTYASKLHEAAAELVASSQDLQQRLEAGVKMQGTLLGDSEINYSASFAGFDDKLNPTKEEADVRVSKIDLITGQAMLSDGFRVYLSAFQQLGKDFNEQRTDKQNGRNQRYPSDNIVIYDLPFGASREGHEALKAYLKGA